MSSTQILTEFSIFGPGLDNGLDPIAVYKHVYTNSISLSYPYPDYNTGAVGVSPAYSGSYGNIEYVNTF